MAVGTSGLVQTAGLLALGLATCALQQSPAPYPNIVVVLADDMGYGDVGAYNPESKIPTPHMDRLAAEGIQFTDAHSADSVCTPTRYALMTGRYCWRTALKRTVLFNYEPPLIETDRMTVASLLGSHGYRSAMIGKWHLGLNFVARRGKQVDFDAPLPWYSGPLPDPEVGASIDFAAPVTGGPIDLGFDYAFYTAGCSTDQEPFCFIQNKTFLGMEGATYRNPTGSWRSGMAAPDWVNETVDVRFTEEAVEFIERTHREAADQPFFLYLALSAPHTPHMVPTFAVSKSDASIRGDMVWLVDWSVGQVADALERLGLSENTLLIVTSDNGPLAGTREPGAVDRSKFASHGHRSAADLRGYKASIFEGGHRVPFIARWPGKIPVGVKSDVPLSLVDLLATSAAIVDARMPAGAGEDSFNMLPALLGDDPERGPIVHHSGGGAFALRDGKWKIVFGQGKQRVQPSMERGYLFDMESDPNETTDLWAKHPEVVEDLKRRLAEIMDAGRSAAGR